jgi:thiol-disulfide isomerase/thioredoxin
MNKLKTMRKIFFGLIAILLLSFGCKTKLPVTESTLSMEQPEEKAGVNFSEQSTWILGYFTRPQMTRPPHSEWFNKGYDGYQFNTDIVNKLTATDKEGITIKLVLGTWCPDSRREVPHFMRLLDIWHFPDTKVTFIGVDNAKLSPVGEYEGLNIERVPTFIFYKNNIEAGRIIEVPLTSLEQDMVNILTKE